MYIYNDYEGWGYQELIENLERDRSQQLLGIIAGT
jgi:hypothetical protein